VSWYTVAWLFWLGFFLLVEGKALFNKREGDTFSEFVWKLFKVQDSRPTWLVVAGRIFLGLFLAWLLLHLTFGWLTPTHPLPWLH
jgi:hypothetical protein